MKQLLLLCSTVTTLFVHAQTSVYHPMPDSNAIWNYRLQAFCMIPPNGYIDDYYSIYITGDTVINSQTYHKLYTPFVMSLGTGICITYPVGYKGAFREDTTVRKAFIVAPSDTSEQLLYDFTLQVGDTVTGYLARTAALPDTIESIDSVLVGSNYRKRWNFNFMYDIHIIEGIGSTYGLIESSTGPVTDGPGYTLTCFKEDGSTLYPDTTSNCELITTINSPDINSDQVTIFPSPADGSFTIDPGTLTIEEIIITDVLGNIIYHQKIQNQSVITINLLYSGTYFVMVKDASGRQTIKKILNCSGNGG